MCLWAILAIAVWLSTRIWDQSALERGLPASVVGWIPEPWVSQPELFLTLRWAFWIGAGLWAFRLLIPFSSWVATACFIASMGVYLENYPNAADHTKHYVAMLMLVHALWYHVYRKEIREASKSRSFWQSHIYPRWVHTLSLFYLGLAYSLAGAMKWIDGGIGWASGLPLQLWVNSMSDQSHFLARWILEDRSLAALSQLAGIVAETAALPALLLPVLRIPVALGLIGFHVGYPDGCRKGVRRCKR